jgi:hypothetical protein
MARYDSVSTSVDLPDSSKQKSFTVNGSTLCLSCGLCCNGILHTYAVILPNEAERVCALGLTVETTSKGLRFRLPCPLLKECFCPVYENENRPNTCKEYQCELLKKFLNGAITLDQALQIIQLTRELLNDVIAQQPAGYLPAGYSREQLLQFIQREKDSGQSVFGSVELREENAVFLLRLAKLVLYVRKNFNKPEDQG